MFYMSEILLINFYLCMPKVIKKVLLLRKLVNETIENYFIKCLTNKFKVMSEIKAKVVEIIVDKLGVKESEVVPEASFTNHLGADSLDTVELIMEFEKAFDITIPDEDAEKIATVGDAVAYIEEHKK